MIGSERAVERVQALATARRGFDRLLDRIHRQPTQNSILLSLHVMALLAALIEGSTLRTLSLTALRDDPAQVADSIVSAAMDFIWTRSHQPLSVPQIAHALNVNRRTLERRFQGVLGHSILAEVNACRLSRARRLLAETDLPIKVVTRLAGFSSDERMRVTFIECQGLSPAAYRVASRRESAPS